MPSASRSTRMWSGVSSSRTIDRHQAVMIPLGSPSSGKPETACGASTSSTVSQFCSRAVRVARNNSLPIVRVGDCPGSNWWSSRHSRSSSSSAESTSSECDVPNATGENRWCGDGSAKAWVLTDGELDRQEGIWRACGGATAYHVERGPSGKGRRSCAVFHGEHHDEFGSVRPVELDSFFECFQDSHSRTCHFIESRRRYLSPGEPKLIITYLPADRS